MTNTVYVLDILYGQYSQLFRELGFNVKAKYDPRVDLVCFTGGTDVDPYFYGEARIKETQQPDFDRDNYEILIFNECLTHKIPMVGICRGSQFLTVMNGGRLIQHVEGHALSGTHQMFISKSDDYINPLKSELPSIQVTSTHHQMMYPGNAKHTLLGWSPKRSGIYKTDGSWEPKVLREPEVVYYPDTNSLAVQYHPEYMSPDTHGYLFFDHLLNKLLSNEL